MRLSRCALAVIAGVCAASGSAQPARAPKQTLASVPGRVTLFAQDERYLAWLTPSADGSGCGSVGYVDLKTRRRWVARAYRGCFATAWQPVSIVMVGARVYWLELGNTFSTVFTVLHTAAAMMGRSTTLGSHLLYGDGQSLDSSESGAFAPVVSDGKSVFIVSSPADATPGPVERWRGVRLVGDVTPTIPDLTALGAGGGRFGYATESRVVVGSSTFTPAAPVSALAVTATTIAALEGVQIEIFQPVRRLVALNRAPGPHPDRFASQLAVSGTTIVYHVGRAIYELNAREGAPRLLTEAAAEPIGLSFEGRRLAWAENVGHGARIVAVTVP